MHSGEYLVRCTVFVYNLTAFYIQITQKSQTFPKCITKKPDMLDMLEHD